MSSRRFTKPPPKPKKRGKAIQDADIPVTSSAPSSSTPRSLLRDDTQPPPRAARGSARHRDSAPILSLPNRRYFQDESHSGYWRAESEGPAVGAESGVGEYGERTTEAEPYVSSSHDPTIWYPEIQIIHQIQPPRKTNRQKKEAQWFTWRERVIPTLVPNYLRLARQTSSFRYSAPDPEYPTCACPSSRNLSILCVYFHRKFCPFLVECESVLISAL